MERYHIENRKECAQELTILEAVRKSRFQLEMAKWETSKLEHQLELVQRQWDESGLEELVNAVLESNPGVSRKSTSASIVRT